VDPTYGVNGIAHLNDINNIESAILQNDGKLVVGGYASDNFAVSRLNNNGTIDTSFGVNGYAITTLQDEFGTNSVSYIKGVDIQSDGKIVAAGFINSSNTYYDMAVARYNANGQLDASFAVNGYITINLGGLADFGTALKIQDDGKIVIGGHKEFAIVTGVPEYDAALVRLDIDGNYDNTFGTDGIAFFRLTEQATYVDDITIQDDGKIAFTGQMVNYSSNIYDTYVCRANTDGSPDLSFGDNGSVTLDPFNTEDYSTSILVQEDGNILVGGYSTSPVGVYNFRVMRLIGDSQVEMPAVDVTFANVSTTTLDVTLTPNAVCESFYFVIMTAADLQQWTPMFGSEAGVIKTFGIHGYEALTHHFTQLNPATDYYVYTVSVGYDGFEAPFDSAYVQTLTLGGNGEALATIVLSEITETSVRMIVTPNDQTAEFHDGLMTKALFDEMGEAGAVEYFQNDGFPHFQTDNWVWADLESNTVYKAIATCKNALGEWGPATIEEFTTVITSVNHVEINPLIIFPNPGQGKFEITGEDIQGGNLRIIDMNGKEVYSTKINGKLTPIDISHSNSGLYIIEIEKDGVRSSSKFLKQ
jgi:uncharacterized delta-60 repeat protein